MGTQHYVRNPKYPYRFYLEYVHPADKTHKRKRCFVGREIHGTGDLEFKETDYKKLYILMFNDLRRLYINRKQVGREEIGNLLDRYYAFQPDMEISIDKAHKKRMIEHAAREEKLKKSLKRYSKDVNKVRLIR